MEDKLIIFQDKKIRRVSHEGEWYFSVVDVISVLTDSVNPRNYWKVLKHRLSNEGNETVTNCNQLKMESSDGKMYLTDAASKKDLFRIIQSIPSKKAEPFKMWLAQVERSRIDEDVYVKEKSYKLENSNNISDRNIVMIFPGNLRVARCFSFLGDNF